MNETGLTVRRRARFGAVVGLIAMVGGACIGGELAGPPSVSTSMEETVHLTAEKPVAVRHLAFEVSPPTGGMNVVLTINAHRFVTETTGEFAEDVALSVRSDDPATSAYAGSPGDARPGAIFSLTELCAKGCESGVTVVVRGTSDARPTDDIAISAQLTASGTTGDRTPLDTTLSLRDDRANTFDGDPPVVAAHIAAPIAVSDASPQAHMDLRLRVDPKLLTDPLTFPRVGSLTLRAIGDPAAHELLWNHWASPVGRVTVNGQQMGMAPESGAYDIDWLRLCTPGESCDVEIGIDIEYEDLVRRARVNAAVANESAPPSPQEFRLTLDALAQLETFDGSELPSDGLALEVTP